MPKNPKLKVDDIVYVRGFDVLCPEKKLDFIVEGQVVNIYEDILSIECDIKILKFLYLSKPFIYGAPPDSFTVLSTDDIELAWK